MSQQQPKVEPVSETKLPTLISLALMTELFDVTAQTCYRWNCERNGRPRVLPEPTVMVGRTPLWDEATILAWAESRGYSPDLVALERLRTQQQGH